MIPKVLTVAQLERVYDDIAEGIDAAGPENTELFLTKLALALGNLVGDPEVVRTAIAASLRDL